MRKVRIYHSGLLQANTTVVLEEHAASHIRVLRLDLDDAITLFNGQGGEYAAKLIELSRQRIVAQVLSHSQHEVESPLAIHLGQVISRGDKMDLTIQKAVELGVSAITPLFSERCGVQLSKERWQKKLEHWQTIAMSACEQSGRNHVPKIHPPEHLGTWLNKAQDLCLVLAPTAQGSIKELYKQHPATARITLLVGPEGGFSSDELALTSQQNFQGLNLGPRILRTETAGLAALAVIQSYWGDLG
jgi:16S rRNA (uracil1498-N3)-methyltransferase